MSTAVVHRTVEEIWFFLAGRGQMWLASGEGDGEVVDVMPGDCLTIPVGTRFQFRAHGIRAAVGGRGDDAAVAGCGRGCGRRGALGADGGLAGEGLGGRGGDRCA